MVRCLLRAAALTRAALGFVAVASLAAALCVPLVAGTPARAATLVFDLLARNPVPFRGLGAQLWPVPQPNPAQDAAIVALKLRQVRTILPTGLGPDALQGHLSVEAIQALVAARAGSPSVQAAAGALRQLAAEVTARRLIVHAIRFGAPTRWETPTFVWQGAQYYAINPDYLQDYVNLLTAELLNARRYGIEVALAELANEPDGGWDTQFTPSQYSALVRLARATFNRYGLGAVRIEGPGTSSVAAAPPFLAKLGADGTLASLGAVSVHDYDRLPLPAIAGLSGLGAGPGSFGKPLNVTEFGSSSPSWNAPPYVGGTGAGAASNSAVWSTAFAVAEVAEAVKSVGDGAAAPLAWQLQDTSWDPSGWGLLDVNGVWKPAAFALQAAFGPVAVGAASVGGASSDPGLAATAFLAVGRPAVVVIANLNATPLPVAASFAHAAWGGLYLAAAYPAQRLQGGLAWRSATATFTVPATSVIVLRSR